MRRRSIETVPTDSHSNGGNIQKISRLDGRYSDDETVGSENSRKNKSLMGVTDEEDHIGPDTCDSYEYVRDMSRIMPDISLSEMRVNPFVMDPKLNKRQKLKLICGALTLLPIRLILITLLLMILTPYGWITYHLINVVSIIFGLQRGTVVKLKYWFRWPLLWIIRGVLFISGFYKIETAFKAPRAEKTAQLLVVAPHRSVWDAVPYLVASQLYGNVTVASRYENSRIPILGSLLMMCDPILVKRDDAKSRSESRLSIRERSKYQKVLIYPEGTCTNGKHLVEFKTGAFIPGQTVQPIKIEYRLNDKYINNVTWTWVGGFRAWQLIVMTFCVWRTDLKVTILPAHKPKKNERKNCHIFARRVAQRFSRELAVPMSRYSFDDAKLMELATELRLPRSLACLRFLRLGYALHIEMGLKMKEGSPPRELLLLQEAQILSDELSTLDEDDFTSYTDNLKTPTVPDAMGQIMHDFLAHLHDLDEYEMLTEVSSRLEFVRLLNINTKYASKIVATSVMDYLIKSLRCDNIYSINALNLLIVMVLCDVRESNIAKRILTCMTLMALMNKLSQNQSAQLTSTSTLSTGSANSISTAVTINTSLNGIPTDHIQSNHPNQQQKQSNMIEVDQYAQQQQGPESSLQHNEHGSNKSVMGENQQASGTSLANNEKNLEQSQNQQQLQMNQLDEILAKSVRSPKQASVSPTPSLNSSGNSSSVSEDETSICITFEQFQLMIWLLLGIENLDKNCFPTTSFSYDYVIENLKNWFTRAVNENLPYAKDLDAQRARIDVNSVIKSSRIPPSKIISKNKFVKLVQGFEK